MKIYIIEDDIAIIRILENIIEDNDLGVVCGYAINGNQGISEISTLLPDIVLVDLLMDEKDGIAVVRELKDMGCMPRFIMISQVSSKNMISKAYTAGVDFFISKPINMIEVTTIIRNITKEIKYKTTFERIKTMFSEGSDHFRNVDNIYIDKVKRIQLILNKLGMSGEKGAKDIIAICNYLIVNNLDMADININELCNKLSTNSKNMEQRIRRAINKGLSNISYLGIEDYMNEIYVTYSNSLFNFEDVKAEMDKIRGKSTSGGKVNIKKFIDGLMISMDI